MVSWFITLIFLLVSLALKTVWWVILMLCGKWEHPEIRRLHSAINLIPTADERLAKQRESNPDKERKKRSSSRRLGLHDDR